MMEFWKRFTLIYICVTFLAACGTPNQRTEVRPGTSQAGNRGTITSTPVMDDVAALPHTTAPPISTKTGQVDDQEANASPTPTQELELFQFQEPNPLKVEMQLDSERATVGVITKEGGSLRVEAADGTTFVLTIAADALLSDQEITLTPLLEVKGQELSGGFIGGVDLAPDGLQLYDTATLTITPTQTVPIENQFTFAVQNREAFLYPGLADANEITFAITHFSGYYLAAGSADDLQDQLERPPTLAINQFLQLMQGLLSGERGSALLSEDGDVDFPEQMAALARSYLRQVLLPRIQQAETSEDWRFVCQVLSELMGFLRTIEFLGVTDLGIEFDGEAAIERLLSRQAELLIDYAEDLCRNNNLLLGWTYALRVARTQAIRATNYGLDMQSWQERCLPPTLLFFSQVTITVHWPYAGNASRLVSDIQAESEVPLRFDTARAAFTGEAPLELTVLGANSMNGSSGDLGNLYCDLSWNPTGSTFKVEELTINLNHTDCDKETAAENQTNDPGIELKMNPGLPSENWVQDCSEHNARRGLDLSNDESMDFHIPWVDRFRLERRDKITDDSIKVSDDSGRFFTGPSTLLFSNWRYSPDRSKAYADAGDFNSGPLGNCADCPYLGVVRNTIIELH